MNEYEAIYRRGFRAPSVILEELDRGRHGAGQVRGRLQALAVDHVPLQVPEDDIARRRGNVVARERIAAHRQIIPGAARQRPYSSATGRTLYMRRPRLTTLNRPFGRPKCRLAATMRCPRISGTGRDVPPHASLSKSRGDGNPRIK